MKCYALALAWDDVLKEKFIFWLRRECKLRNLSLLIINEKNVKKIIDGLERGRIKIDFLLDCASEYTSPKDLFTRLCYAVKDSEGEVVCDPDDTRQAANKAVTHYDLVKAGISTPFTIIVRDWEPKNFRLTKEELKKLGRPFIIKPASGFGQKGVVRDAKGSIEEIARARRFNRGDSFLLQQKIEPLILDNKEAWFRVYFMFGEIIPCWWDTKTGFYRHVSLKEMYHFKLLPLARMTSEIARITAMDFFTTEIALTGQGKEKRFVVVDYVNDQPELRVRSGKTTGGFIAGPVPEVIEHIAQRIVEIAWDKHKGQTLVPHRSIWLSKSQSQDESI